MIIFQKFQGLENFPNIFQTFSGSVWNLSVTPRHDEQNQKQHKWCCNVAQHYSIMCLVAGPMLSLTLPSVYSGDVPWVLRWWSSCWRWSGRRTCPTQTCSPECPDWASRTRCCMRRGKYVDSPLGSSALSCHARCLHCRTGPTPTQQSTAPSNTTPPNEYTAFRQSDAKA